MLGRKSWNMFDPDLLAWQIGLGVDRQFLASLFEIRQALEPLAAAAAARYRSEDELGRMTAAWTAMREGGGTRDGFTAADLAFHRAILDASPNPFLRSIGSVIEAALALSFTISSPLRRRAEAGRLRRTAQARAQSHRGAQPSSGKRCHDHCHHGRGPQRTAR